MSSQEMPSHSSRDRASAAGAAGWILCFLLAHHLAVIVHEYAHSFVAFALGYKDHPLRIQWGGLGVSNLLLLSNVDEHVDYQSMFAQGAGWAVALVALAGPGFGNGLTYLVSLFMVNRRRGRDEQGDWTLLFAYALNVMSVGNFFSYVPIRTFVSHGDIAHISQGLDVSPWLPLIVLGLPTMLALCWLFKRTMPDVQRRFAPESLSRQRTLVASTAAIIFGFFGTSGLSGYGEAAQVLSCISLGIAPVVAFLTWPRRH